jgi:hypothetical protein
MIAKNILSLNEYGFLHELSQVYLEGAKVTILPSPPLTSLSCDPVISLIVNIVLKCVLKFVHSFMAGMRKANIPPAQE